MREGGCRRRVGAEGARDGPWQVCGVRMGGWLSSGRCISAALCWPGGTCPLAPQVRALGDPGLCQDLPSTEGSVALSPEPGILLTAVPVRPSPLFTESLQDGGQAQEGTALPLRGGPGAGSGQVSLLGPVGLMELRWPWVPQRESLQRALAPTPRDSCVHSGPGRGCPARLWPPQSAAGASLLGTCPCRCPAGHLICVSGSF